MNPINVRQSAQVQVNYTESTVIEVAFGTCLYYDNKTGRCKMKQICAKKYHKYIDNKKYCTVDGESHVGLRVNG